MSSLKYKVASLAVAAMAIGAVLFGSAQFANADKSSASKVRDKIVSVARAEEKKNITETSSACNKYLGGKSTCVSTPWCGAFVQWVWDQAGVKAPTSNPLLASNWGSNKNSATFKKRGKGKGGNPQPGDVVVYGKPGAKNGHVAIVVKVHKNGNIDTIDGNSSNRVRLKRNINPAKATNGFEPIWGYRSPVPVKKRSAGKKRNEVDNGGRDRDEGRNGRNDSRGESDRDRTDTKKTEKNGKRTPRKTTPPKNRSDEKRMVDPDEGAPFMFVEPGSSYQTGARVSS